MARIAGYSIRGDVCYPRPATRRVRTGTARMHAKRLRLIDAIRVFGAQCRHFTSWVHE